MPGTPRAEIEIGAELVRDLLRVQATDYASLLLATAGEGWDNVTFRLGQTLAVRMPRREAAAQLIVNEQRCLPVLAPRLPVATPAPVFAGRPGCGFPWSWSIIPWIDGEPVDLLPLGEDAGATLAGFLRALHRPAEAWAPSNPNRGCPLAQRVEKVGACIDRVAAASDLVTPAVRRAWDEALAAPAFEGRLWLHGDLHARNVLAHEGRIVGVIDWGDMCAGDPATDLGAVWGLLGHRVAREAALAAYAPDADLLARAKGWAVLFGATLVDFGRIDDPRHAGIGEAILRRIDADG